MTAISALPHLDLPRALGVDAAASGAMGILLAAGNAPLEGVLGIPAPWLLGIGVFLLVYAADLLLMAVRPSLHRFARVVVVGNAAWVVASVLVVLAGGFDLTVLGVVVVLAQAAAVTAFAVVQAWALGRVG